MKAQEIGQSVVDGVGELLAGIVKTSRSGSGADVGELHCRQRVWWGNAIQVMNFPPTVRIAIHSELGSIDPEMIEQIEDVAEGILEACRYVLLGGLTSIGGRILCLAGAATAYESSPAQINKVQRLLFIALCGNAFSRYQLYRSSLGKRIFCYGGAAEQSDAMANSFSACIRNKGDLAASDSWESLCIKVEKSLGYRKYVTTNRGEDCYMAEIETPDGRAEFRIERELEHPHIGSCMLATLRIPYMTNDIFSALSTVLSLNDSNQQSADVMYAMGSWTAIEEDGLQFVFYQWLPGGVFDVETACSLCISIASRARDTEVFREIIGTQ